MGDMKKLIRDDSANQVEELIDHGTWPRDELTVIMFESTRQRNISHCMKMLIDHHKIPVDGRDENGDTILHVILKLYHENRTDAMKELSLHLIQAVCKKLQSTNSVEQNQEPVIDMLQGELYKGLSPLHWAVMSDHVEAVRCLLLHGANIDIDQALDCKFDDDIIQYRTPLIIALEEKNEQMVCLLIKRGAIMNRLICADGETPVHLVTLTEKLNMSYFPNTGVENIMESLVLVASTGGSKLHFRTSAEIFNFGGSQAIAILSEHCHNMFDHYDLQYILGQAVLGKPYNLKRFLSHQPALPIQINGYVLRNDDIQNHTAVPSHHFPNLLPHGYFTPLQLALRCGNTETVQIVLQYGANPNLVKGTGSGFIVHPMCHIESMYGLSCFIVLLRFGCELNNTFSLRNIRQQYVEVSLLDFYMLCGNLFICRMLHLSGATRHNHKLNLNDFHRSRCTLQSNELISAVPNSDIINFRRIELNALPRLQQLARLAVRSELGTDKETKINKMPLPMHLSRFLNFEEFDIMETNYRTLINETIDGVHM